MNSAWLSALVGVASLLFTLVTFAIGYGVLKTRVEELRTGAGELKARMAKCEEGMGAIAEVKTAVAVLTEKFGGAQLLAERDGRELRHDIAGLKLGVEGVLKELRERRPN